MVNWESTFREIERARPEVAVLPIGSVEQHSHHLPVGTDYLVAQVLGERVARELGNCYLLPALPFSCSREHQGFGGTVWLRPATLAAVVEDLVAALGESGIGKVVLIVAHGGNWIVKPTVREINLAGKGPRVIYTQPEGFTVGQGEFADLHAGRAETSLMLHLHPGLVKMKRARRDHAPKVGREFLDYVGMKGVSPTGVWGAPSGASAEEGEALLREATRRAVEYIRGTFAELERAAAGPRRGKRGRRGRPGEL